jgi:hypothetical protein
LEKKEKKSKTKRTTSQAHKSKSHTFVLKFATPSRNVKKQTQNLKNKMAQSNFILFNHWTIESPKLEARLTPSNRDAYFIHAAGMKLYKPNVDVLMPSASTTLSTQLRPK